MISGAQGEERAVVMMSGLMKGEGGNGLEETGPCCGGAVSPLGAAGNGRPAERTGALSVKPLQHTVLAEYVLQDRERECV